ncbi:MAG: hypothetical protein JJU06_21840 [Ectothiorhodospiraceae bacterium]|nr:hypothetical protein [Ectothiorhodospiraceae bacterium]MCH8504752.1 hypothetical protein [Ectothiorhodospiraceae bacterium]
MTEEFIQIRGRNTLSMKQIDRMNGLAKGTTFRLFKSRQAALIEGEDYILLRHDAEPELLESLRASGQIYPSTVNALLLTETGYRKLRGA